ncbi:hypothetical protein M2375_000258 [Comamonas sp. BIGb0152]|uniref:hypothetical protein n=1 Tax=Comamonas sp. BIGb0152 TaxID=2940601 RepID=UPI00216958A7|nr:hypothetical protein [Comamonas sp. BIGb0152]MCS4292063.1 hypothetical protein [Comamonas sp. BIGb0152]
MKVLFRIPLFLCVLVLASLLGASARASVVAAADVVPEATFQWGSSGPDQWGQVGLTSGGLAQVTTDFPNSSNGSLRLDLPITTSKAGLAFYPGTPFGKLSELSAVSFEWLVHTTDVVDQAPVLRLYLRNAAGQHTQTLVYTPDIAGVRGIGLDQWTHANVLTGIVWQGRSAAQGGFDPNLARPFTAFQADPRFADMVVFAVEGGAGNGSSGFVGAIDNIVVEGPQASVSANFEVVPPVASIQCDQSALQDSAGQTTTCTVTLSRPTPYALSLRLITTGDTGRYSGCAEPLEMAAGASSASCVLTATANTTQGDGSVTLTVAIAAPNQVQDYSVLPAASSAEVRIANDDGEAAAPPASLSPVAVPSLSHGALALLCAVLAVCACVAGRRNGQWRLSAVRRAR